MTRRKFTSAERAQIAQQYLASGKNQVAFAAEVGVCPRTLRNFLRRHTPSPATGIAVENTVRRAVKALRAAADTLEASMLASTTEPLDATTSMTDTPTTESPPVTVVTGTLDAGPTAQQPTPQANDAPTRRPRRFSFE